MFNRAYSLQEINEFHIEVCRPVIENPANFEHLNIGLLRGNKDEFTEEMIEQSSLALESLKGVVIKTIESLKTKANEVPKEYCDILRHVIANETKDLDDEEKHLVYEELIYTIIEQNFVPFLQSSKVLNAKYQSESVKQNEDKIKFVAESLRKIASRSTESYILSLKKCIDDGGLDRLFDDIVRNHRDVVSNKQQYNTNDLIVLLHSSILPIKRNLTHDVSLKLIHALQIPRCCYDDFLVYNKLLQNIANFTTNFYSCLQAKMDEAESKTRQLDEIKIRLEEAKKVLSQKRLKNEELKVKVDQEKKKAEEEEVDVISFLREMAKQRKEKPQKDEEENKQHLQQIENDHKKDKKQKKAEKKKQKTDKRKTSFFSKKEKEETPVVRSSSTSQKQGITSAIIHSREVSVSDTLPNGHEEKIKNRLSSSLKGLFEKRKKERKSGDDSVGDSETQNSSESVYPFLFSSTTPTIHSNVHF